LAATATDHWQSDLREITPTSAAQVQDDYHVGFGEMRLDLTGVPNLRSLDGRDISIEGSAGTIEVVVPAGMDVTVDAVTRIAGDVQVFGQTSEGPEAQVRAVHDGGDQVPDMTIDINLGAGQVIVREQ